MQRRLLFVMAACAAVFLVTSLVASIGYPGWAWILVVAGLLLSPVVGGVAIVLLVVHRRQAKPATR